MQMALKGHQKVSTIENIKEYHKTKEKKIIKN